MAACIAPRRLIVIHGDEDPIFPDAGVREAYATIQKVYEAAGVPENCALVTGHGRFFYKKTPIFFFFLAFLFRFACARCRCHVKYQGKGDGG